MGEKITDLPVINDAMINRRGCCSTVYSFMLDLMLFLLLLSRVLYRGVIPYVASGLKACLERASSIQYDYSQYGTHA